MSTGAGNGTPAARRLLDHDVERDRRPVDPRLQLLDSSRHRWSWHSLFVDARSWHRVENDLAGDRSLVIITGPGHGSTPDPGRRYSLNSCAAAAADVLASLGVTEPVDWVGNAWGGHVGVIFATRWADRCRTLVTLGTPIHSYRLSERALILLLLVPTRVLGPVGAVRDGLVDALLSPKTRALDDEAVALVRDCLATIDRGALINAVVSVSLQRPDLTSRLTHIGCPTLLVTGSDHSAWTPRRQRARASSSATARLPSSRTPRT